MMNSFGVFLSHYETRVFFPENPFAAPWIGSVQVNLCGSKRVRNTDLEVAFSDVHWWHSHWPSV